MTVEDKIEISSGIHLGTVSQNKNTFTLDKIETVFGLKRIKNSVLSRN